MRQGHKSCETQAKVNYNTEFGDDLRRRGTGTARVRLAYTMVMHTLLFSMIFQTH